MNERQAQKDLNQGAPVKLHHDTSCSAGMLACEVHRKPVRMLLFPIVINSASQGPESAFLKEKQLRFIILVDLGVKNVTCKLRKSL